MPKEELDCVAQSAMARTHSSNFQSHNHAKKCAYNCSQCIKREVILKRDPSWIMSKKAANWNHSVREDRLCPDFSKMSKRKDIVDGYYSAHEKRFSTVYNSNPVPDTPTSLGFSSDAFNKQKNGMKLVVPHAAHVPQVNINKYASRDHRDYFYLQGMKPIAADSK